MQITETSWIDWDDQNKLEKMIKKQKSIEQQLGFDPQNYFGGMKVDNLEQV